MGGLFLFSGVFGFTSFLFQAYPEIFMSEIIYCVWYLSFKYPGRKNIYRKAPDPDGIPQIVYEPLNMKNVEFRHEESSPSSHRWRWLEI